MNFNMSRPSRDSMSYRRQNVLLAQKDDINQRERRKCFNDSSAKGDQLLHRYAQEGRAGLADRSDRKTPALCTAAGLERTATILRRIAISAAAAMLASCASVDGISPAAKPTAQITMEVPASLSTASSTWPEDAWWTAYGDPQLNLLVERAVTNSPTLANAQTRIARAQATARLAQASKGVQVTGAIDASYGRLSENYQIPKPPLGKGGEYVSQGLAAVNFGYELDLWGRNAALIRGGSTGQSCRIRSRCGAAGAGRSNRSYLCAAGIPI